MELLRLDGAVERDPAIEVWFENHPGELREMARRWFKAMCAAGDEVRQLLHDGCPVACLGDAAFSYVNAFAVHVNIGFFRGAELQDPKRLLQGNGKCMRHVKLRPGTPIDTEALSALIEAAYQTIKSQVENG
ncbi:MAG: DUF1801 domain-containing protein [Acidobacteriota bacterium]